jgi:predicted ATPase
MITELRLNNFKAFEKDKIELKPITILLGPNNSGKSSLLAALRILAQTVNSDDNAITLLLNGSLGDFGTYKDIVYSNNKRRKLGIGISFSSDNKGKVRSPSSFSIDLAYKFRAGIREIVLHESEVKIKNKLFLRTGYSEDTEKQVIKNIFSDEIPVSLRGPLSRYLRMQNFIPFRYNPYILTDDKTIGAKFLKKSFPKGSFNNIYQFASSAIRIFKSLEYIGAIRAHPVRTFLFSGERREKVGANGQYAATILAMDSQRGGKKSKNIIEEIKKWLLKANLASDLIIEAISDRHYELKFQHPITKEYENFADIGFGHSQVLPVLIAGFNLEKQATLLVEQPEIHLHPKAQAELGDFFLSLYERGTQSIIETHSEYIVLRLQQFIIQGKLNPNDIIIYYIHANQKKKEKDIVKLSIDEFGNFVQDWPEGFFPEKLIEAKKIAQLRYSKLSE